MYNCDLPQVELAIIGGSGITEIKGAKTIKTISGTDLETPFGLTSSEITYLEISDRTVVFLNRHGNGHIKPPSEVPYHANAYALAMLGVKKTIGISACGVLSPEIKVGTLTVPDQLVDFTKNRVKTFFDKQGLVVHISMAKPFCQSTREELISAVTSVGLPVHDYSTYLTIEGPQFSTEAESRMFAKWGCHLIGMTTSPEAHLMREAGICYVVLCMPTDHDAGLDMYAPVTVDEVIKTFTANIAKVQLVLPEFIRICKINDCECHTALKSGVQSNLDYISIAQRHIFNTLTRIK